MATRASPEGVPLEKRPTRTLRVDTGELRRQIVDPVLDQLLKEGELDSVDFSRDRRGGVKCRIVVRGEVFTIYVWTHDSEETVEWARFRLLTGLQDDFAVSSFAWGEWRGPKELDGPDDD